MNAVLPNDTSDEILLPKHLVHQHPQLVHLVVVDADKDSPVLSQQLPGQHQARIHHGQPGRVVAAAGLGVGGQQVALSVCNVRMASRLPAQEKV
ncbi:hypothetical protein ES703_83204 [subsurface metagenome]